jgi:hypothetical protein
MAAPQAFRGTNARPSGRTTAPPGRYHWLMKMTYVLGALLVCSLTGALVTSRTTKTALLAACTVLSAYGLFRILG